MHLPNQSHLNILFFTTLISIGGLTLPTAAQERTTVRLAAALRQDDRADKLMKAFRDGQSKQVMVAAHRGEWHEAPENSLAGIRLCIDMGVDIIETDLCRSRDGHFVLMHDKTLDRTTNGTGRVDAMTLAQLQQLRLKNVDNTLSNERVPTLAEAVELTRGRALVYWDKTEDCIDEVVADLDRLDGMSNAMFYGRRSLNEMRSRYGSLLDRITYLPKVGDETADMSKYVKDLSSISTIGAFVIEFKRDDAAVFNEFSNMKTAGRRIWASPLWAELCGGRTDELALSDPDGNWGWLIDRGVNVICTDRPRQLLNYLRKLGLHE